MRTGTWLSERSAAFPAASRGELARADPGQSRTFVMADSTATPLHRPEGISAAVLPGATGLASEPVLLGRQSERAAIDGLLRAARDGRGGTLVLRGEPGVGKTALLDYAAGQAPGLLVVRVSVAEAEMKLAFAALHQTLLPLLDRLGVLPGPQRDALRRVLGLEGGAPPSRFLVSLAVLTLIRETAAGQPMLLIVDDAQFLDAESAQVLAFVARRLSADAVATLFAVREPARLTVPLDDLPSRWMRGLPEPESRELFLSLVGGLPDEPVIGRVVAETGGNPLALAGVAGEVAAGRLTAGSLPPGPLPVGQRLTERFLRPVRELPESSQALLLLAAAEPSGNGNLIWLAAARLGLDPAAADPAEASHLAVFEQEIILHPLVRSAVYHGAPVRERRRVHGALAEVLDFGADADRRAWHRSAAVARPDEQIASELERSAECAWDRSGYAASGALLARAAELTPQNGRRAERMVAAATAELWAGAFRRARELLAGADPHLTHPAGQARARVLDGRIRFALGQGGEAPAILLQAARALQPHDPQHARAVMLEALEAALYAGRTATGAGVAEIASAAAATVPLAPPPQTMTDRLLAGYAAVLTGNRSAGAPLLRRIIGDLLGGGEPGTAAPRTGGSSTGETGTQTVRWLTLACRAAGELLDDQAWHALASRCVRLARDAGELAELPRALKLLGVSELLSGHFAAAEACRAEELKVSMATGGWGILGTAARTDVSVLAWRGREAETRAAAAQLAHDGAEHGRGIAISLSLHALATLELGLGRYQEATAHGLDIYQEDPFFHGTLALPGLIEAAVRAGRRPVAAAALDRFAGRAQASGTPWAAGLLARSRALLASETAAEPLYREAISQLQGTPAAPDLARAHLLYGEWLRRQRRRRDARTELRTAWEMLHSMGAAAFAARAEGELRATSERAQRGSAASVTLTPQEAQIAALVAQGASNREVAEQLFISVCTVEYHLRKVFRKLGVSSRAKLVRALLQHDQPAQLPVAPSARPARAG
jgi:DNA-binding CsgD family transcriptional regulator